MTSSAPVAAATPNNRSVIRSSILKRRPDAADALIDALAPIWDEVVQRIITRMMSLEVDDLPLHHNIRAEMIDEIGRLSLFLGERVLDDRLSDRDIAAIDVAAEREACFGQGGEDKIAGTAKLAYDEIWSKLLTERWIPKSAKALERDANPRRTVLAVKPVEKNHFIPKSIIRDFWATNGQVQRWRRTAGGWTSRRISYGVWGHRRNLWSDRTEAWFGLLEGDAREPINRLLQTRPLNDPQRDAFVGYLVIQMLRNPYLVEAIGRQAVQVAEEIGHDDPDIASKAYDTLFRNNQLYDAFARPLLWSRWALVRAETPAFVLPDVTLARADLGDGLRLIAPLTPQVCFVTLPDRETEKRVVPFSIKADAETAALIGDLLVRSAVKEFLAPPEFAPRPDGGVGLDGVLDRLVDMLQD